MRTKTTIGCCYECKERHYACHDTCETYIREKKRWEAEKAAIRDYRTDEFYLHKLQSISKQKRAQALRRLNK